MSKHYDWSEHKDKLVKLPKIVGRGDSGIKEIECTVCGAKQRWEPVDDNIPQERTAFILAHAHDSKPYADTDSMKQQQSHMGVSDNLPPGNIFDMFMDG